jgi:ubiquinone/menaquinone biosynthesis C-methylase UbiE
MRSDLLRKESIMNSPKAEFFDTQAEVKWACADYTLEESAKIGHMLHLGRIGARMSILEPGCGTGRLTRILADRVGPGGRVLAMDISAKMVDACLRKLRSTGHVVVLCAAVEEYPLSAREFDAIICHQVFPHFDDKPRVLSLFSKALAPSGVLIVYHFINSSQINDLHRAVHAAVSNDLMPSEGDMSMMFHSAGFVIDVLEDDENGYLLIAHLAAKS